MKRSRADRRQEHAVGRKPEPTTNRIGASLIWITIVLATAAIPIYYSPAGKDPFRFPKEILLRAEAIMIAAIAVAWPWQLPITSSRRESRVMLFVLLIVAWTIVITLTSTHRVLSLESLIRVVALAIIFVLTYLLARGKSLLALLAVIAPACINAADYIVVGLQQGTLFRIATTVAERPAAFLGNPDDIGAFFVAPALACITCATLKGVNRVWTAIAALLIGFALVATQTLTGLIAFGAGLGTLALVRWRRRGLAVFIALIVCALTTVLIYPPLRTRVRVTIPAFRSGNIDAILSGRLLPSYAAWRMFEDHPIVGVGPGCFGWQYFSYKLNVARDHPALVKSPSYALNFGEAHNDHLQMLAVGGLPAYLLFIGSLSWVATMSFRREGTSATPDQCAQFARIFALPFAVSFMVMAVAGFPLEVAATTSSDLFLAALLVRWSE
jgi:O-antigen ligase